MRTEEEIIKKKEHIRVTTKIAVDEGLPDTALKVQRARYELLMWVLEEVN